MDPQKAGQITRRAFAGAAAFSIIPRHVMGAPFVPPSDRITVATVGLGRQGQAVTQTLLARPDVQVVALCDVNRGSKNYIEYGNNALLQSWRALMGPGNESWGQDLASPGRAQVCQEFSSSLGMGGREPVKRAVEAYYAAKKGAGEYKGCNTYSDYRELLSEEKDVDAVYIATPDHWHAAIALASMRRRKHVLCQKPMAHSVSEARRMAAMAREMRIASSTPVTNTSSDVTRVIKEWIDDGAIGPVREVHNWTGRPYWPQGIERPKEVQAIPEGLDWNMWVGPAEERAFNNAYLPFVWRGWYDFGCGSYGDMGCYSFSGLFNILNLTPPTSVECQSCEAFAETFPKASVVYLDFPENNGRPPIHMAWYDGGIRPARPKGMLADDERLFQHTSNGDGVMYVGDKGIILAGFNGDHPRVYPESKKYQYTPPARQRGVSAENAPGNVIDQWVKACKGGEPSSSNFDQQAPVSEAFLLGCLAQRFPGERLVWDAAAMKVTNSEKANKYVNPAYRGGFTA